MEPGHWVSFLREASRWPPSGPGYGPRARTSGPTPWTGDVVVVSHVSPIKAAVAWALGVGDETSWRMFVDVASVTCIGPGRVGPDGPTPSLRSFNATDLRPSE